MKKYYKKMSQPFVACVMIGACALLCFLGAYALWNSDIFQYLIAFRSLFHYTAEELSVNGFYSVENNELLDWYAFDEKGYYYVTSVADRTESGDYAGYTYMGFYVYEKDVELAERLVEATWESMETGEKTDLWIKGRGYLAKMDSMEKSYFKQWFTESGAPDELVNKLCYKTFYLIPFDVLVKEGFVNFAVSLLVFLASLSVIIWEILYLAGGYRKSVSKYIRRNNIDTDRLGYELDGGTQFACGVVSERFVLGYSPKAFILRSDELVWVYRSPKEQLNSLNGAIHTGSLMSYRVILIDRNGNKKSILVQNRREGDAMADAIAWKVPFVFCGFDEELDRKRKQDFGQMVRQVDEKRANDLFYMAQ